MDLSYLFKNTFLYYSSYKQQSFNEILVTAREEKDTEIPPRTSFKRCFISESDKSLFSPASPPGPAGTSKRMHCQRIIKMHLKIKNKSKKTQQPRIVEGKFRQHSAYNSFGFTKQKIQISSKEPIWLILLVPSHPLTRVINKRHTLKYFIT